MRLPILSGTIERRILVNYRVAPDALARILPRPFRPWIVNGFGIGGVCLIRLGGIRVRGLPRAIGITSENAAHRIAVEWDTADGLVRGVYVPRRDTSSWINRIAGGRVFPGEHHAARFDVAEGGEHFTVSMASDDGSARVAVAARVAPAFTPTPAFASFGEASQFFESGSLGCSATRRSGEFDAIELRCSAWRMEPLDVERVESSFFDDRSAFPEGSASFDSAMLMRGVDHEWHGRESLCA